MATRYKIYYALFDQAHRFDDGTYWTWRDNSLSLDILSRFYDSILGEFKEIVHEILPKNKLTPEVIYGRYKKFEDYFVVYRFYDGIKDRSGRHRCVILTAWLKNTTEGDTSVFTDAECREVFNLPRFKKLCDPEFAQNIPIRAWETCEVFPSRKVILQKKCKSLKRKFRKEKAKNKLLDKKNIQLREAIKQLQQQIPGKIREVKFVGWIPPETKKVECSLRKCKSGPEDKKILHLSYQLCFWDKQKNQMIPPKFKITFTDHQSGVAQLQPPIDKELLIKALKNVENGYLLLLVETTPAYDYKVWEYQHVWWTLWLYRRKVEKINNKKMQEEQCQDYDVTEMDITDSAIELKKSENPFALFPDQNISFTPLQKQ